MDTDRREFIQKLAAGAAMFGAMPLGAAAGAPWLAEATSPSVGSAAEEWDLSWVGRVKGKHRAVFDVPEVDSGYGVWRASIWPKQYQDVLKIPANDISVVLVLRHNGIALAMKQEFWDKYGIGDLKKATHPVTQQGTPRNPALMTAASNDVPAQFDGLALPNFLQRGGIALGCNLALQECVELIRGKEGVSPDEARKQALGYLVPGVIIQPSGMFACLRAQEAGCMYFRAS